MAANVKVYCLGFGRGMFHAPGPEAAREPHGCSGQQGGGGAVGRSDGLQRVYDSQAGLIQERLDRLTSGGTFEVVFGTALPGEEAVEGMST